MIITVICPLCGKTIQIEENNDANICVCCNRAFITKNSQRVDNKSNEAISNIIEQNNNNGEVERLYNNIIGLLDKNLTNEDKYLNQNLEEFKTKFPLDNRIILINHRLNYNSLINNKFYDYKKLFDDLENLKNYNEELYQKYYNDLYEYIKMKTNEDYDSSMLDFKFALINLNKSKILTSANDYKKELEIYNKNYETYKKEKSTYDSIYRSYYNDLNRWLNSGNTLDTPSPKKPAILNGPGPSAPREPHNPNEVIYSSLKGALVLLKKAKYGIDHAYLLKLYNFFDSNFLQLVDQKGIVKAFLDECFNYLDKKSQEEIIERIKQKNINETLAQIKEFFNEFNTLLKLDKIKKAYKYINHPICIKGKTLNVEHEKSKFSKSLFTTKYLGNINTFSVDEATKIAFEKTNYKF